MKIIVAGSLGNISKPLTKILLEKVHVVTVISSKSGKQKEIQAFCAAAAIGSLEDIDFLAKAFTSADSIYCMVRPNLGEVSQVACYRRVGSSYASAIQQSGVQRIVHLSSYGAHLDKGTGFILGSHNVEGILNELSEVAVTHLRSGYFYYNLFNFICMIKTAGFTGANYGGDDKLIMVHPNDVAEAAAIIGNAIGKPGLKWPAFTNEQSKEGLEKTGMPAHVASNFVEMVVSTHSGAMREDYDLHKPAVMGKVKLVDFAREFAAAFNKA